MQRTIHPFIGMDPPTVDTFTAQVRGRYISALHSAIGMYSANGELHTDSVRLLGVADGMVSVLYDLGASDAYTKLKRLERVTRLLKKREGG